MSGKKSGAPRNVKGKTIDYKDVDSLRKVLTEQGKLQGRKRSGCNAYTQRQITLAVKRARLMGLLPFVVR